METRPVEVYYGYYAGNTKLWDTMTVYSSEEEAVEVARKIIEDKNLDNIAFIGVFCVPDEG